MDASGAGSAVASVAKQASTEAWPAKIIFGEPKGKDEFGGLGHERSARALADGIRQLAERTNGRTRAGGAIGLEGAWGAGKSTVIDIAKRNYLGAEYLVFTFDLWRHQSDDFRRALLEQLITFVRTEFNPRGRDKRHIYKTDDPRPKVDLDIDRGSAMMIERFQTACFFGRSFGECHGCESEFEISIEVAYDGIGSLSFFVVDRFGSCDHRSRTKLCARKIDRAGTS
jgi:hypothetical protein